MWNFPIFQKSYTIVGEIRNTLQENYRYLSIPGTF